MTITGPSLQGIKLRLGKTAIVPHRASPEVATHEGAIENITSINPTFMLWNIDRPTTDFLMSYGRSPDVRESWNLFHWGTLEEVSRVRVVWSSDPRAWTVRFTTEKHPPSGALDHLSRRCPTAVITNTFWHPNGVGVTTTYESGVPRIIGTSGVAVTHKAIEDITGTATCVCREDPKNPKYAVPYIDCFRPSVTTTGAVTQFEDASILLDINR